MSGKPLISLPDQSPHTFRKEDGAVSGFDIEKPYATLVYKGLGQKSVDRYNYALSRIMETGDFDLIKQKWFAE